MPSTYSTLAVQLMATGENATTWGTVTNTNLGTAIEEAIVGSADVTFSSGNVTLSLTNTNSTQTARNMRLRCTGTTGGSTRNLIIPTTTGSPPATFEKPYIVQNDCADSILVKTAAGSGVTIPAGKTMWVYSNGTDVVEVTNYLTTLSLGTPLPLSSGGLGATTASGGRTTLGLGTMAVQNNDSVNITGGTISGLGTAIAVADGGTGAANAASARTNLGAQETLVSGTNIKTVNGSSLLGAGNIDTTGGNIPSGTKMLFVQTSAPTGWTKDTTHNNKALRVVTGAASSGGSVTFTSAFTSQTVSGTTGSTVAGGTVGDTTLTSSQIPAHTHFVAVNAIGNSTLGSTTSVAVESNDGGDTQYILNTNGSSSPSIGLTSSTGGDGSHTHGFTGTGHTHSFSGSVDLAVQYVDVIICTKS